MKPKLDDISIIASFSDGKCRQVYTKKETTDYILQLIISQEGIIRVSEEEIEGIKLIKNRDEQRN